MATRRPRKMYNREITERKPKKRYPLGCDVAKEEIFDYPYLVDKNTIALIEKHGRIMFIIRGPNSTMKATLSEMIMHKYPSTRHCCADHFFSKTFSSPERTKETIKSSHVYCKRKVEEACMKNISPIIVQNTHIRKWELQKYLNMAAAFNYTVIMAITLYKFEVTPEALDRNSTDGLNIRYFRNRTNQWEDISPVFTGLFLCPDDTAFILKSMQKTLTSLLSDGRFCRVFNICDADEMWNYFAARRNLFCILGYSHHEAAMKKYYLSDLVQENYGKSYSIIIQGYVVTLSAVMGIILVNDEIKPLTFEDTIDKHEDIAESFGGFTLNSNIEEYKSTTKFDQNSVSSKTAVLENNKNGNIDFKNCKLIHLAHRKFENFDITNIEKKVLKSLFPLDDDLQYTELEEGIYMCRLPQNVWIINPAKSIMVQTIFTGLYV